MLPSPNFYTDWKTWAQALTRVLEQNEAGYLRVLSTKMPPAEVNTGKIVFVEDLGVLKGSNGTVWKTITWV